MDEEGELRGEMENWRRCDVLWVFPQLQFLCSVNKEYKNVELLYLVFIAYDEYEGSGDRLRRYLYIVEEIQNILLGWNLEDMYG